MAAVTAHSGCLFGNGDFTSIILQGIFAGYKIPSSRTQSSSGMHSEEQRFGSFSTWSNQGEDVAHRARLLIPLPDYYWKFNIRFSVFHNITRSPWNVQTAWVPFTCKDLQQTRYRQDWWGDRKSSLLASPSVLGGRDTPTEVKVWIQILRCFTIVLSWQKTNTHETTAKVQYKNNSERGCVTQNYRRSE